jgi:hypothetical protein
MPRTTKRTGMTPLAFSAPPPPPPPPAPQPSVVEYLKRHFPDFALSESTLPSGELQVTLYRVSDGAYYRFKITAPFLALDSSVSEVEAFFEQQGLRGPLPRPAAGPILVDRNGISFPNASIHEKDERVVWRRKLRQKLLLMRVQEATGL